MKNSSIIQLEDLGKHRSINNFSSICYAIMCMNTNFLNGLLDKDINYEDIGKAKFIEKLNCKFSSLKALGDKELLLDFDYCEGCNCNLPVCKFIGNNSRAHFALYFEIKDNKIKDIYHCNWYDDIVF
ncbi:hypothetical protein MWU50_10245 [Flavobacteriaceae bacterium S0862]|nr:hypothetical protein [Flavobacteriaceae bacterium S0862]